MEIKPIRTEADYQDALAAASAFFDQPPARGTPEGDRFEVLLTLLNAYESARHPIEPPDPIEAIKFRMEQQGLTVQDLVPMIGATNRVYEVLNRTRPLTLSMMKRLRSDLQISGDVLLSQRVPAGGRGPSARRTPVSRRRAKAVPVPR
ncbi:MULTISPECIES: type II toxin-antitoxin system HigA family antitoxin [unclassified Rubrivivax]|uniref:helix-turn-helix domain-containing protein n=1 Tax=unclassified Rubrivivax TaxID=2649762 RepID=UPI001E47FD3B|nr:MULTISPECIES: transcriptional regulator [unclassified Rubrivivax]MCC9597256.1 transcriptional regulator [Rubrivivax sp. JA1055]MCC9646486.1 transcriptional regulator [Rubrivivax sp. JA1029]